LVTFKNASGSTANARVRLFYDGKIGFGNITKKHSFIASILKTSNPLCE
jgi:hypothetical protein